MAVHWHLFVVVCLGVCYGTALRSDVWKKSQCGNIQVPGSQLTNVGRVRSKTSCAAQCFSQGSCNAFSYWPGSGTCGLTDFYVTQLCDNYNTATDVVFMEKQCLNGGKMRSDGGCDCSPPHVGERCQSIEMCHNNGTRLPNGTCSCTEGWTGPLCELSSCLQGTLDSSGTCLCRLGYVGSRCDVIQADCHEGFLLGHYSGIEELLIQPPNAPTAFKVPCVPEEDTYFVFSVYLSSSNFSRDWVSYRDGFAMGTPLLSDDYWIGLNQLHYLSHHKRFNLTFNYQGFDNFHEITYVNFLVDNEANLFRMSFDSVVQKNMGDCLTPLKGVPFSTFDRDNDNSVSRNCALDFQVGWWFDACALCNPLGRLKANAEKFVTDPPREVHWRAQDGSLMEGVSSMDAMLIPV